MQFFGNTAAPRARARISRVLLVAAMAAVAAWLVGGAWPRRHALEVTLTEPVVALHVEFQSDGEVMGAMERRWPDGRSGRVRLSLRLAPGTYEVLVRTEGTGGAIREETREVLLTGDDLHALRIGSDP